MREAQKRSWAVLRAAAAMAGEAGCVGEQGDGGLRPCLDVADGEEPAIDAVVDQLGDAADAGGDGGDAAGHGLERGQAEGLHLAGHAA